MFWVFLRKSIFLFSTETITLEVCKFMIVKFYCYTQRLMLALLYIILFAKYIDENVFMIIFLLELLCSCIFRWHQIPIDATAFRFSRHRTFRVLVSTPTGPAGHLRICLLSFWGILVNLHLKIILENCDFVHFLNKTSYFSAGHQFLAATNFVCRNATARPDCFFINSWTDYKCLVIRSHGMSNMLLWVWCEAKMIIITNLNMINSFVLTLWWHRVLIW